MKNLRSIDRLTFLVVLTHRTRTNYAKIAEHRVFFDSFQPILCAISLNLVTPMARFAVQLPSQPVPL